jgi:O-antigen/teichoic acid export membrane protein
VSGRLRAAIRRLKAALTPGGNLLEQSVTGGIWLTALNVSGRVFQILTLIFLARLLTPAAFGIIGVATVVIVGLKRVSKLGLDDALIYNKNENVDGYLNTAWMLEAGRGVLIGVVVFAAAPLIASFFSEPEVLDIIRVMAVAQVLLGLKNPAIVYFRKDFEFHRQFVYEVGGEGAYFFIALAYALVEPTVWALAAGYVARGAVRFVLSYLLHGYRPWPSFDLQRAREMINYGKWITGESVLNYVSKQGDDIFVGWLLGSAALGFYQFAYRLSNAPATEVTHVISQVSFPAYSKVQDDKEALRSGFYRTVRLSTFLVAPMAVGIAVVAPVFVIAFLGEQWQPMIVPMQLLAVYGMVRGYLASFGSVWRATGDQDYLVKVQLLTIVLIAIPIYPAATAYGLVGVSAVIVGVYLLVLVPVNMYLGVGSVDGSVQRLAVEFAYPLPAAGTMALVVYWVREALTLQPLFEFPLLVLTGVLAYGVAVLVMEAGSDWGIIEEIRTLARAV